MPDKSLADEVRRKKLTYLSPEKLKSLYECIDDVETSDVPGDFSEFGVALGGSGICLASSLSSERRYLGFDVFGMIPPPSLADGNDVISRYEVIATGKSSGIGGDKYYGYVDDLYNVVRSNFSDFGLNVDDKKILLIRGLFSETLTAHNDTVIALAHIDCDWYEPVSYCLHYVWPRLSPGGLIVLDDYNDWSGCRKATDEFLSSHSAIDIIRKKPHAVLRKPAYSGG